MDKLKLKWKIFSFLLIFCTLLLLVLWLFQTVFLTDMYKLVRKNEMKNAISLIEKNVNNSNLQTIIEKLEENQEILVVPTRKFIPPPAPVRDGKDKPKAETLTESREFDLQSGEVLALTFHAMITPVNATVSTLQVQLYIVTGIMILLSILIAIVIAKKISRPIEDLSKSAKVLANGNYDARFAGHGFLEIKELSDTLNTAAAELSTVENLRRELLANISHDLRTPLALIYSYAEMMQDFPKEITPEQTQTIKDETMRLTSLVNDILDISRLETGVMELNYQHYNLTESLLKTLERIGKLVEKEGYSIHFTYDETAFVMADEGKVTQALYNLVINAINYSGVDKTIWVHQYRQNGEVRIEVMDSGEGISPENLPHIWERYYKVDKSHKRAVTGTGLGLSIVKKIIDLHEGSYGVESISGKGSTFWFTLPEKTAKINRRMPKSVDSK